MQNLQLTLTTVKAWPPYDGSTPRPLHGPYSK